MELTATTLVFIALGIAFQYLLVFLAVRHANEKQDKKIQEFMDSIKKG